MTALAAWAPLPGGLPAGLSPWLLALLLIAPLAATLEGLVQTLLRRAPYDWRAYFASVTDAIGRRAADMLGLSLATPILAWAHAHRIYNIDVSGPAAFVLLFLGQEFLYYWYHRAAHRVGWFWATHSVHHSANELTLAAAFRLGWTGKLTGTTLFFVPLVWLGFPPLAVLLMLAINLHYQFWLHAPWLPRLGPLEWLLNTPAHHKVHHSANPEYLDRNYGGILIIFDRMFGTYADERADVSLRYGLTTPLRSYNPLRIALHGWADLIRRLLLAQGWRGWLRVLLGPPGGTERPALRLPSPANSPGHTVQRTGPHLRGGFKLACIAVACAALLSLSGCGFVVVRGALHLYQVKQQGDVEAALLRYAAAVQSMDAGKLAERLEPQSELVQDAQSPIVGRDAMAASILSSGKRKVVAFEIVAQTTTVDGKSAVQSGSYQLNTIEPDGQTKAATGRFEARWAQQTDGQWLIARMQTTTTANDTHQPP